MQQVTSIDPDLPRVNSIWDRTQTTAFFVQETSLNILYIWQTRKFLRDTGLLRRSTFQPTSQSRTADEVSLLYQLIYINVFVICLDIVLLIIQFTFVFYVQGAFKPCVYGIKLKAEFMILNRLVDSLQQGGQRAYRSVALASSGGEPANSGKKGWWGRFVNVSSNKTSPDGTQGPENLGLGHLGGDHVLRVERQGSRDPIVTRVGAGAAPGFAEGQDFAPFNGGLTQNDVRHTPRVQ